MNLAKK
jgi:ribosome biogenesis protein MAK21